MKKEETKQQAKIVTYWHSLYWWVSRGARCSDCGEDKDLNIARQKRKTQDRINSTMLDEVFVADFECRCGCKFTASYVVRDALPKKPIWAGGDLWD